MWEQGWTLMKVNLLCTNEVVKLLGMNASKLSERPD